MDGQAFEIPTLDFGRYLAGATRHAFSTELVRVFQTVGFVYLRNHGIDMEKVESAMKVSRKFFELDKHTKLLCKRPEGTAVNSGYVPVGMEKLNAFVEEEHKQLEFREAYNFLPFDLQRIPREVPAFSEHLSALYDACWHLGERILAALAEGLQLSQAGVFKQSHRLVGQRGNPTTLRTLLYPPVYLAEESEQELTRCGTHSDYGTITLLFQDDVGGLEVENRNDEFVPAVPVEGCVLVNVGDLLQRWTSDVLRSTRHRVRLNNNSDKLRQSLAFFVHPDDDFMISCLDGSKKYPPITAGDYLQKRFKMTY